MPKSIDDSQWLVQQALNKSVTSRPHVGTYLVIIVAGVQGEVMRRHPVVSPPESFREKERLSNSAKLAAA
jgi:hypothetical protein